MRAIGIDIGTTTISVLLMDGKNGEVLADKTITHHAFLDSEKVFHKIQDAEKLVDLTVQAVKEMTDTYGSVDCIGLTGQMHGVLYVDQNGKAVSPLYTWQDGCGNEKMEDGKTYAQALKENVGAASSGFGLTTHYYLQKNNLIPETAVKMATISDYVGMRLCNRKDPVIAPDMAASWGCFDLEKSEFLTEKMEAYGVKTSYLPELEKKHGVMGTMNGVPVITSLGDNQASVLGSVQDLCNTVLVNIGTGSQVSFGTGEYFISEGSVELRPCTESTYLMVGSGLCGGRAYAMLEQFYQSVLSMQSEEKNGSLYSAMEAQARAFLAQSGKDAAWKIRTTFSGTRSNPEERGSVHGIGVENFNPGAMTVGMIQGILGELHEMYEQMCEKTGTKAIKMVGSGNGIRQNTLMREMAEEMFGMKLAIPACREEAAYGAALNSLFAAGFTASLEDAQSVLKYI